MTIALVSEDYYPEVGGVPEHVYHLSTELGRRGHQVLVITSNPCEAEGVGQVEPFPLPPSTRLVRLGRRCGPLPANGSLGYVTVGRSLGRELAALLSQVDVVHVQGPLFPVLPLLALRNAPAQVAKVATLHTHFQRSVLMRLVRGRLQGYLDSLDEVIAVSESAARSLLALGLRLSYEVIENGVDLAYWRQGRRLGSLMPEGIAGVDRPVNVLLQARLEPRNRVDLFVRALGLLRKDPSAPAFQLLVVGDGPLRFALEALVHSYPGETRPCVRFLGTHLTDRHDFTQSADVYGVCAEIASHPMSLLEGMAAGLPLVCFDLEGIRPLVTHGECGLLCPHEPGDQDLERQTVDRLSQALLTLGRSATLRKRLGREARRRVTRYSWVHIARRIESVYFRALAASTRSGSAGSAL